MIAKVKIAPVEQWCKRARQHIDKIPPGKLVDIDTASMWLMTENGETFRNWRLVGESQEWLREIDGAEFFDAPLSICEHMLEMD